MKENVEIIRPRSEGRHISDHDGLNMMIELKDQPIESFNIISFNLEGLCRHDFEFQEEDTKRMLFFSKLLKQYITNGTICVFQEIVLQKVVPIEFHNKFLEDQAKHISSLMLNDDMIYRLDDYTGGVFYDSTQWNLIDEIIIPRRDMLAIKKEKEKEKDDTIFSFEMDERIETDKVDDYEIKTSNVKYSNAYLFKLRDGEVQFWLVNIH